jgi:ATP-dependent Clp endopeptidase proteolytic subunit ClpP
MSDGCEECDDECQVYAEGNTVFFFCDVTDYTVKRLCILLKRVSLTHDNIKLCINSPGGNIYSGFAGLDYIRFLVMQNVKIETIAYGMCASAATFLLLGGSKRSMGKNAYVLIHQMSDSIDGTFGELQCSMRNNKKHMKHFRNLYLENTKVPEEYLEKLLTKDIVLSANKCIKYGIVHELI